jgi:hypothetical protein
VFGPTLPKLGLRYLEVDQWAPPNSGECIQKLGDFQSAASQHRLAVAQQQHVKVVIEQFVQRSFNLGGIIEFGFRNQAQRARWVADDRVAQEQDAAPLA